MELPIGTLVKPKIKLAPGWDPDHVVARLPTIGLVVDNSRAHPAIGSKVSVVKVLWNVTNTTRWEHIEDVEIISTPSPIKKGDYIQVTSSEDTGRKGIVLRDEPALTLDNGALQRWYRVWLFDRNVEVSYSEEELEIISSS